MAYHLAAQFPPYSVYTRAPAVRRFDPGAVPFFGWEEDDGLTAIERSEPSDAGTVARRAGLDPGTRLVFTAGGRGRMRFRIAGRPSGRSTATVRVRVDETLLAEWTLPPSVETEAEVEFDASPRRHALVLEYTGWRAAGGGVPKSVLLSKIQILEPAGGGRDHP